MRIGGQAMSYVTTPQGETIQFGDTGSADNFRRYLESIGESPIPDQFSPLSQQPLPMGQHPLMGLSFRQEGDMGRYVADNDPGGIAAGYSNLKDFLAAGNLPQPTEGVSQDVFGNPNILGAGFTPYTRNENLDLTDRSGIMSEYNKYIQGGMGSRAHTTDMRGGYSFMGEDMAPGSSTGFGDFRKFLDTYGIGDRLQMNPGSLGTAQPLQQMEGIEGLAAYQSQQNTGPGI